MPAVVEIHRSPLLKSRELCERSTRSYSPIKKPLLDLSSAKTLVAIRIKQCAKLAVGLAIIFAVAVIWDGYPGIKHAVGPGVYVKEPFYVGAMLMLYSVWFSIIGILALANSLFDLPAPVRGYDDDDEEDDEEGMRVSEIAIRMFVTVVMMVTLLWSTWYGIKLTMTTAINSSLYALAILTGVATATFGVVYFLIGAIIMRDLLGGIVVPPPPAEGHSPRHSDSDSPSEVAAIV